MMISFGLVLLLVAVVALLSQILKEISSLKSLLERVREDIKDLKSSRWSSGYPAPPPSG